MAETTPLEAENLGEIDGLNQRGGRMLSMVDLLEARTVSAQMAGFVLAAMARGASLFACAGPGGAGKTALLGASLNLLPPGERLVTVGDARVLREEREGTVCFLAHEIGRGRFYGYLWGRDVVAFLERARNGDRGAGTIHADDPDQVTHQLAGMGVSETLVGAVGLLAFIRVDRRGTGARHTVHSVYERSATGVARQLFTGDGNGFRKLADSEVVTEAELGAGTRFFEGVACSPDLQSVRREVVRWYGDTRE